LEEPPEDGTILPQYIGVIKDYYCMYVVHAFCWCS